MDTGGGNCGFGYKPGRLFHVLEFAPFTPSFFVDVSGADIEDIRAIYSQLQQHDAALLDIQRLAQQLGQLKEFPHQSPLRFLGYFAVLESLLTHYPKPSDPYDSITRQVKNKLALLNRRFTWAIDYGPFDGAKPETIWSKMYEYRSRVAHGGVQAIDSDLKLLKNHETALTLVKEVVKAVIRQALVEPQLIIDLREC